MACTATMPAIACRTTAGRPVARTGTISAGTFAPASLIADGLETSGNDVRAKRSPACRCPLAGLLLAGPAALRRALQVCVQTLDDPVQGQCRHADVEIVDRLRGNGIRLSLGGGRTDEAFALGIAQNFVCKRPVAFELGLGGTR